MQLPLWSITPFVVMLASIAILPLVGATKHWWEKPSSQLTLAVALGIPTAIATGLAVGWSHVGGAVVEYIQFISLILSLFVVAGGIHLRGDIQATPKNNTVFLAIGGTIASFVGTTGAAMLLIRPLLATNKERKYRVHTVLYTIFIVANCGGLLTPLGDPPLFLGMLRGVPFAWTLHLFPEWLLVNSLLLISYYALDKAYYAKEPAAAVAEDRTHIEPLRVEGKLNFLWFAVIVAAVALLPSIDEEAIVAGHAGVMDYLPIRELIMLSAAACSYFIGDKQVRYVANQFSWAPVQEVGYLFIGIFLTMVPALLVLDEVAPKLPLNEVTFFLFTGGLSSVLDNAPTYATFFEMAGQVAHPGGDNVAGVPELYLVSVSLGAVLCGAITYIGNGPNFMVKSVAESDGVEMPSFGGYVGRAMKHLVPVIAAMVLIFIAPGILWKVLGGALTAAILGLDARLLSKSRRLALADQLEGGGD